MAYWSITLYDGPRGSVRDWINSSRAHVADAFEQALLGLIELPHWDESINYKVLEDRNGCGGFSEILFQTPAYGETKSEYVAEQHRAFGFLDYRQREYVVLLVKSKPILTSPEGLAQEQDPNFYDDACSDETGTRKRFEELENGTAELEAW